MELQGFSTINSDEEFDLTIYCGLCTKTVNIKWRCIQCNMKICDNCRIIHRSAKSTKEHAIISFNDVDCCVLDRTIKNRIKALPCQHHPYQNYSLYCKSCELLVCDSCIPQKHLLHDIFGIDQFITEKLQEDGKEVSDHLPPRFLARSQSREEGYCLTSVDFHVIHTVVTPMPVIHCLKTVSYLSAWIGCDSISEIQQIKMPIKSRKFCIRYIYNKMNKDIECNQIDQIQSFQANSIELINEDILFVSINDQNLKRAFTDAFGQRQILNIYDFDPLEPICLHIEHTNSGVLYWFGLKEPGNYEVLPTSTRKLIAYSETWQLVKSFEFAMSGKRLFTVPYRIKTIAGQICVLDHTSEHTGRVLAVNSLGHRMWEYNDPQETSTHVKPFFPTAIATTESSKIVVADTANSAIHILNTAGNVIAFKSTIDLGIEHPYSLDIDENGQLWVGSACDKDSDMERAKIFVIKMTIR